MSDRPVYNLVGGVLTAECPDKIYNLNNADVISYDTEKECMTMQCGATSYNIFLDKKKYSEIKNYFSNGGSIS